MDKQPQNQEKTKSKKRIFLIIILCILMIFSGLVAGIFISNFFNHDKNRQYDDDAENIRQEESPSISEEVCDSIAIPCWDTIAMIANQTEQKVNFYNPEKNKGCDFQLTLSLEDGTELWKSQLISNGKAIYNITLNNPLEAGTYKAQLKYDCFTESGSPLNGSVMNFNLIMKTEETTDD